MHWWNTTFSLLLTIKDLKLLDSIINLDIEDSWKLKKLDVFQEGSDDNWS